MMTKSVAHFRNGIGNFVLYTPALRAIASLDPSGMIDLCVDADWEDGRRGSVIDLAKKLPFIQDVFLKSDTFEKTYKTWFWSNWSTHGLAREIFSAPNKAVTSPPLGLIFIADCSNKPSHA